MKITLRFFLVVVVAVALSYPAFSACVLTVASQTAPVDSGVTAGAGYFTPDNTNTPASLTFGGTSQAASELLITDDGGAPNCFAVGQVNILFNAVLTGPLTYRVHDSNGAGVAGTVTATTNPQSTLISINVTHAGTQGDLIGGSSGTGVLFYNLIFDVTGLNPGDFLTASASTNPAGGVAAPTLVNIGQIASAGSLNISPATVIFPDQLVNTISSPQQITLSNGGSSAVVISNIAISGGFQQQNTCGSSIAVGGFCTISVTFTPLLVGPQSGTITITDNAINSPQTITLTGNGILSPGVPTVTAVSPNVVVAGGPAFNLTVTGSNFAQGSTVLWNSSARPTTFLNNGSLSASIPATDLLIGGAASVAVSNAGVTSNAVAVTIRSNPKPLAAFVYAIPHIAQGGGYVTKITMTNPGSVQNNVSMVTLDQSGNALATTSYTIAPHGTLRIATPSSVRFGAALPFQWALVGASGTLNINSFLEAGDSTGRIINTVGFNTPDSLTDFSIPVSFAPGTATVTASTAGIALANVSDASNVVTLQLLSFAGFPLASDTIQLEPFGQRAIDLTDATKAPNIARAVAGTSLTGTLAVSATMPISAVALAGDAGQFAATPVANGRATLTADQITGICPSAAEIAAFNADIHLSFEQDPTSGTLVCRSGEGSADLTRLQRSTYQALRIMKSLTYDAPFPFTSKSLYDWLKGAVGNIRMRGDITTSFCCDTARSIDIAVSLSSPFLQTSNWLGPYNAAVNVGMNFLPTEIARLARQAEGFPNSCGVADRTISEMGSWAVAMDLADYNARHSFSFLNDTQAGDPFNRYRDVAASDARNYVSNGNFCGTQTTEVQTGTANFGLQGTGDLTTWRTITVSAGIAGPTTYGSTTLNGTDYTIVNDSCQGTTQPPSCNIVVGFAPKSLGQVTNSITLGTALQQTIFLTGTAGSAAPVPSGNYIYVLPHIVTGAGFDTTITLSNLADVPNDVVVRIVNPSGVIQQTSAYQLLAGGTLRINVVDPSLRFGSYTTNWAVVASRQPLNANEFFDLADSKGTIVNAIGFNAAPAMLAQQFPVEFERNATGFIRTVGLALANPSASGVSYTLTLFDSGGNTVATYSSGVGAYNQTAFDLATLSQFSSILPQGNFVGSVRISSTGALSAIALGDDLGPFSATPPVPAP